LKGKLFLNFGLESFPFEGIKNNVKVVFASEEFVTFVNIGMNELF